MNSPVLQASAALHGQPLPQSCIVSVFPYSFLFLLQFHDISLKQQDAADNDISDEITDSEKADNAELTDASENTQDKADNVTDDNNNQVSDIKNPDTMDTKASEKTYEKDNRKKEYNTEIKKVSRKLKKGFEAADMHVDIIV